ENRSKYGAIPNVSGTSKIRASYGPFSNVSGTPISTALYTALYRHNGDPARLMRRTLTYSAARFRWRTSDAQSPNVSDTPKIRRHTVNYSWLAVLTFVEREQRSYAKLLRSAQSSSTRSCDNVL